MNIGRKEGIFLVFLVSVFLIAGAVSAYNLGFDDPSVMGHSYLELERPRCVSYSTNLAGTETTSLDLTLGGTRDNICIGPAGCDILFYMGDSGGIDIDYGDDLHAFNLRYFQDNTGDYMVSQTDGTFTYRNGRNGIGPDPSLISFSTFYNGCTIRESSTSLDEFVIEDNDGSRFCAVSICGRDI